MGIGVLVLFPNLQFCYWLSRSLLLWGCKGKAAKHSKPLSVFFFATSIPLCEFGSSACESGIFILWTGFPWVRHCAEELLDRRQMTSNFGLLSVSLWDAFWWPFPLHVTSVGHLRY